jgi:hypothetical protein
MFLNILSVGVTEQSPRALDYFAAALHSPEGGFTMLPNLLFPHQITFGDIQQDFSELQHASTPVQFFTALGNVVEDLFTPTTTIVGSTPMGAATVMHGFHTM